MPGSEPKGACTDVHEPLSNATRISRSSGSIRITMPSSGLNVARDPRIPDTLEALPLHIEAPDQVHEIRWFVDDTVIGTTSGKQRNFLWGLTPGHHVVKAEVLQHKDAQPITTEPVGFWVR